MSLRGKAVVAPPVGPVIWEDTQVTVENLPASSLTNVLTGQVFALADSRLSVATALADFPVALLAGSG